MNDQDRNADDEPEPLGDSLLDEALEGAFAAARDRTDRTDRETGQSVLQQLAEQLGNEPPISLRDAVTQGAPLVMKPLGAGGARVAGKYVVQGVLAEGGVGAVHKGYDTDLGRDVAMKFLHERFVKESSILHRFVEEAQIGGQLQHPGIVPVYELGMSEGRPFFTMEIVQGQTLALKLSKRTSSGEDRREFLRIFESICQTMAYAHTRDVVHRDLKPANIMIGRFGEVQVVDWGMGKVLRSGGTADERRAAARHAQVSVIETLRSTGHGTQSVLGSVMGTPAYMPPEQARGDVDSMDERSDVFALGAILCEVLTGQPPYVGEQEELIGIAALARLDDAHARLAACGAEAALIELAKQCLMPSPAARPESAGAMAKVVHAHLAAAEQRVYEATVRAISIKRTQKLSIALMMVFAAGLSASVWFWRDAEVQREAAETELQRANEIKQLITEMLTAVNPDEARGKDKDLLKGILDATAERLASGAIEDELVLAELHAVVGEVYSTLGLRAADEHLPVALQICSQSLGEDHPTTLRIAHDRARLYGNQRRFEEAAELMERTLAARRRVLGDRDPDTLRSMITLGMISNGQRRWDRLEELVTELQGVRAGMDPEDSLWVLELQGRLFIGQGRITEADQALTELLEGRRTLIGTDRRKTFDTLLNLSRVRWMLGRYSESEKLAREAVEIATKAFSEEPPLTRATYALGSSYAVSGRREDAARAFEQSVEIERARARRAGGDHDPDAEMALARVYLDQKERLEEARGLLEPLLARLRQSVGDRNPRVIWIMARLTGCYEELDLEQEAHSMRATWQPLAVAAAEASSSAGMNHDAALSLLAPDDSELADPIRARRFAQAACDLEESTAGGQLWVFLDTLSRAEHRCGDTEAAVRAARRALSLVPEVADDAVRTAFAGRIRELEGESNSR